MNIMKYDPAATPVGQVKGRPKIAERRRYGRSSVLRLVLIVVAFAAAVPAAAQNTDPPETGPLHDRAYIPALDGVCGLGDDRQQGCAAIRARDIVDAAAPPWSAIGRLNFASTNLRQHCTGTLIGESTVLTAAHCLYNLPRKTWIPATSLRFVAGYQRGAAAARAAGVRYVLDPVQDSSSRDFRGSFSQDWALVELDAPIGRQVGILPLPEPGDNTTVGSETMLAGYAGLLPHALTVARDCGPWQLASNGKLGLGTCAAMTGDSGAPVLIEKDGRLIVIGVHNAVARDAAGRLRTIAVPADVFRSYLSP